jgi:hypothetical protein
MLSRRAPAPSFFAAVRRSARGVAALFAFMLIASNACAAMGLCIAKNVEAAPAAVAPLDAPCPQHVDDGGSGPADPALAAHCPQDDPTPQGRLADLPVFDTVQIGEFVRIPPAAQAGTVAAPPPLGDVRATPLYARPGRLLL